MWSTFQHSYSLDLIKFTYGPENKSVYSSMFKFPSPTYCRLGIIITQRDSLQLPTSYFQELHMRILVSSIQMSGIQIPTVFAIRQYQQVLEI